MALTPVEKLIADARDRRGKQSARVAAYMTFLNAYFEDSEDASGLSVKGSNADGRPILRLQEKLWDELRTREGSPNLLAPMIDDIVSLRGIEPTSTMLAESREDGAEELSVQRTRALRQQHEQSRMTIQLPKAAFFLSCLGDTAITLDPLLPDDSGDMDDPFRPPGVYINVLNPSVCFPKFLTATQPEELDNLYVIQEFSRDEIEEAYGVRVGEERADVIHYYSRTEKQIIVGKQRHAGVEHALGFCPAQWVQNKITDGRQAQADIARAVKLHDKMKSTFNLYTDSVAMGVYPMIHVHDADQVAGDQIEVGPGAVVYTTGSGSVSMLPPAVNSQMAKQIFDACFDNIMKIVGTAPVRIEGQIDRSNVSARSVSRQQEGMHNRTALALSILGFHYERMNAKIALMLYGIPRLRSAQMSTWGVDKHGTYTAVFDGNLMGGWHRNKVKWDAWAGADKHERLVMAIQLLKEGLVGGRRVLEEYGDDDPEATLEEAKKFIAEHQAAMAPPPPGGPPGAAQPGGPSGGPGSGGSPTAAAEQAVAMSAGAMPPGGTVQPTPGAVGAPPGGAPPPAMPGFAPVDQAPADKATSPLLVPDVGKDIIEAIARVRLHGTVPEYHPIPGGLHVGVTDHRDIAPLKMALRPLADRMGGKLEVKMAAMVKVGNRSNGTG